MDVVGEFLGYDQDVAISHSFRRHHPGWVPVVTRIHRPTCARQAANLGVVQEHVWARVRDRLPHDPALSFVDRVPVPVCRCGRARRCSRFRGEAASGYDQGRTTVFSGVRSHLRACGPGMVAALPCAPANASDRELAPELVEGATGQVRGDRNDGHPLLREQLAPAGIACCAPYRKRQDAPDPVGSHRLRRLRWRSETVAAPCVERYHRKRLWARDAWHLTGRMLRQVLSHTLAVFLCLAHGHAPLHFAQLLA